MRNFLRCPGRGIGAFTANGQSKILAFSSQKLNPSIYVYKYPELTLRCELEGSAQLEYTALALSGSGPYLACCSSVPDHSITVWDWEKKVPLCSHAQMKEAFTILAFNSMNWHQICAMSSSSLVVWNIERSENLHILKQSVIDLPATDGSVVHTEKGASRDTSGKLSYLGPQMPTSAIAGVIGEHADTFVPKSQVKPKVSPSCVCWSPASHLYVGCREGLLLRVNPESLLVSILHIPEHTHGDPKNPALVEGSFLSMVLHKDGLLVSGEDGFLHSVQVKGTMVEITQSVKLDEPASSICYSPDKDSVLLATSAGHFYHYKPSQSEKAVRILEVLRGDFVAASPLYTETNRYCVSVRDSGGLQLWSMDNGLCIASISLHVQVTTLACCLVAQYVAVGTASGQVLFVDLSTRQHPRLVHRIQLYHTPVEHLLFEHSGNFLIISSSDTNIFLLDSRPSKGFEVIGYIEADGPVVSLSSLSIKERNLLRVAVVCGGRKDEHIQRGTKEGKRIMLFSLPYQKILAEHVTCVDQCGCILAELLQQVCHYETELSLSCCALTLNRLYAYCTSKRTIQTYRLPESVTGSSDSPVSVAPDSEVEGHPLGPALLLMSPHHAWLATIGRDGLLCLRDSSNLDSYVQFQCHSSWLGGARCLTFTSDNQSLLCTGLRDGSLVCLKHRHGIKGAGRTYNPSQPLQSVVTRPESDISAEDAILSKMSELDPATQSAPGSASKEGVRQRSDIDVTEQDDSYCSPTSASLSSATWLEKVLEQASKGENQKFTEIKQNLRKSVKELRDTIQVMMRENEALPEMERLEQQEFNLDTTEKQRLQAEGEQEVQRVRSEIEMENLAKRYLREVLKRECWDSMKVKGKAIKAFHSSHEVNNYPMKEQTPRELDELLRVENMRRIEHADSNLQQEILEQRAPALTEEEDGEEGSEGESAAICGSLSAQYGGTQPLLYSQFSLHIREQKINQITLLQDVIYKVKSAFNREFNSVYKQKEQEMQRVRERNRRITEIMAELDIKETLWEPTLSTSERPERALTVDDSEIKVERFLSLEQKQREEEQKKEEERRRLEAKGDNIRERALDEMMGGVLEVKKEDVLKMEISQPEHMTKPELQWTEEDRKAHKDYEKKVKDLQEEQEKYRKTLESEMKKLQTSIKEATQSFDETLTKLFERKVKSEMVIYQEELKIANLIHSILIEDEILNRERELSHRLEKKRASKQNIGEDLKKYKEDVEAFRETYDNIVAEDKLLDRGFRKEFFDIPGHLVDQLYKLYKKRPRVHQMRTQTDVPSGVGAGAGSGQAHAEGLAVMLRAMEELDSQEHMPEGLDPAAWQRFCNSRRTKVESEHQVKTKALTLAEMQAFLQRRTDEDENARVEIMNLIEEINSLREEKMRFRLDIMVQVLIKQGQVEVEAGDFVADYSDSLLLHRSVVEDLNTTIRTLGEQKIASMVECKDFRRGIIQQEWEHRRMHMLMEHLNNKARDIQMLRVSQALQEYLSEPDHDSRMSKQVVTLEKTIAQQEQTHQKNVQNSTRFIKQLEKQAAVKAVKNTALDAQLASMQIAVAERRNIYHAIAMEDNQEAEAEQRYQEILERKRLVELAKEQAQEVAVLRAEVERMRMKTFPALGQFKHS